MKEHGAPILAVIGFLALFVIHLAFAPRAVEQTGFPDPGIISRPVSPADPCDERQPGPGYSPLLQGSLPDGGLWVSSMTDMAGFVVHCEHPAHWSPADPRQ
jgi:hypothetical protein